MLFSVPLESRQAELGPGDFNLILTDGSANLLLDPSAWMPQRCRILPPGKGYEDRRDTVLVSMNRRDFNGGGMQDLLRNTPAGSWFIDNSFHDANTDKAVRYLLGLAAVAA